MRVKQKQFYEDDVHPDFAGQLVWYGGEWMTWEDAQAYEAQHRCSKSIMDWHDSLDLYEREADRGDDERRDDDEDYNYDADEYNEEEGC